jgi:uncharacterized protein involved in cysteine biosynthesis
VKKIIAKSLKDIFSKDVILFVLQISLGALVSTGLFVWYFWDGLSHFIRTYLSWIPWEWLQTSGATVITFALAYMLFIVMISLFTSLFSEKLLIKLAKKHYPTVEVVGSADIMTSIIATLKASLIFLILFILAIPFLFIPIVGQLVMLYLWSILIKEPTVYDVGSLFIKDKQILKKKSKKARLIAIIASLFNYIPVLNIFAPVFAQILFLHYLLGDKQVAGSNFAYHTLRETLRESCQ